MPWRGQSAATGAGTGNRALAARSLVNLILNAAEATLTDGRIEVRLRHDAGWAVLEVHDDGPGVPPHLRPKVFEVFYTTKQGVLIYG